MSEIVDSFFIETQNLEDRSSVLIEYLKRLTVDDILSEIEKSDVKINPITPANVSQFSNIDVIDNVIEIVDAAAEEIDFAYVGYMINKSSNEAAQRKYGENHLKLAIQMGLITQKPYRVTELGHYYISLSKEFRKQLRTKLYFRIPVIQRILVESRTKRVDGTLVLQEVLSESTAIRRRSNIRKLVKEIQEQASNELKGQIAENIVWS